MSRCGTKKSISFFDQKEWYYHEKDYGKLIIKPGAPRSVNEGFKDFLFDFNLDEEFDFELYHTLLYEISEQNIDFVKIMIYKIFNGNDNYDTKINDDTKMIWYECGDRVDEHCNEYSKWIWFNDIDSFKKISEVIIKDVFDNYEEYNREILTKFNDINKEEDFKKYKIKLLQLIDELNSTTPYAYLKFYIFDDPYQAKYLLDKRLCYIGIPFDFFKEYKRELFILDNELKKYLKDKKSFIG
ncbi:MAG: hypothetical protein IKC22_07140 [Bacilli bacterium]|nr:hypothetical protein [Bacilli bacterium]